MKPSVIHIQKLTVILYMIGITLQAHAEPIATDSPFTSRDTVFLAQNETDVATRNASVMATPSTKTEYAPPFFSGSNAHKYMGLTTIALAVLTAVTSPGEGCESNCPPPSQQPPRETSGTPHTRLARATGVMALATVTTGLIYHWDDFHLEDGFSDPDNQHVLLATTGALAMLYAINKSMGSAAPVDHAGMAEAGAVAMAVAIKLTW